MNEQTPIETIIMVLTLVGSFTISILGLWKLIELIYVYFC